MWQMHPGPCPVLRLTDISSFCTHNNPHYPYFADKNTSLQEFRADPKLPSHVATETKYSYRNKI